MDIDRRRCLKLGTAALATIAGCVSAPQGDEGTPIPTSTPTPTETPTPAKTSTPTATSTPAEVPRANGEITIKGSEWKLVPAKFRTQQGQELSVTFKNVGSVAHNLAMGKYPVEERSAAKQAQGTVFMAKTKTIQPDNTASVRVTPDTAGTYPYWCDVSGHRKAGMHGRMIVE